MTKQIGNSELLDVFAANGPQLVLPTTKRDTGWQKAEQPPHQYMNWLQARAEKQLNYLLMTGLPVWHEATPYTAGALCRVALLVYQATADNVGSAPPGLTWRLLTTLRAPGGTWAAPTGATSRATFDPSTVTLEQLAQRVSALIGDLYITP